MGSRHLEVFEKNQGAALKPLRGHGPAPAAPRPSPTPSTPTVPGAGLRMRPSAQPRPRTGGRRCRGRAQEHGGGGAGEPGAPGGGRGAVAAPGRPPSLPSALPSFAPAPSAPPAAERGGPPAPPAQGMAAPGPPRLPQLRLGPRLRAGLEVALRVPSLFLIDAIFNSAPLPGGSVSAALLGALLRLLGETPSLPPLPRDTDRAPAAPLTRRARRGRCCSPPLTRAWLLQLVPRPGSPLSPSPIPVPTGSNCHCRAPSRPPGLDHHLGPSCPLRAPFTPPSPPRSVSPAPSASSCPRSGARSRRGLGAVTPPPALGALRAEGM